MKGGGAWPPGRNAGAYEDDGQNEILDSSGDHGTKDAVRSFDIWSDADGNAPADGAMDFPSDSPVPTAIDVVIDIPKDATPDAASDLRGDSVAVSDARNDACTLTTLKATAILARRRAQVEWQVRPASPAPGGPTNSCGTTASALGGRSPIILANAVSGSATDQQLQ